MHPNAGGQWLRHRLPTACPGDQGGNATSAPWGWGSERDTPKLNRLSTIFCRCWRSPGSSFRRGLAALPVLRVLIGLPANAYVLRREICRQRFDGSKHLGARPERGEGDGRSLPSHCLSGSNMVAS